MAEMATEFAIARCQTSCDDDCEAPCHESHEVLNRRHHDVAECEAGQKRWAETVAELEQLRESKRMSLEINQGWVAYRERTKARRREFLDRIATLTSERDALRDQFEFDSKRVYNAQVRAERLSDTIDRVRTVLLNFGQLDKSNQTTALEALEKIDEIIDGEEDEDAPA